MDISIQLGSMEYIVDIDISHYVYMSTEVSS